MAQSLYLTYEFDTASMNCFKSASLLPARDVSMSTVFAIPDVPLLLSLQTSHSEDVASRGPPGENPSPSVFAFHPKPRFHTRSEIEHRASIQLTDQDLSSLSEPVYPKYRQLLLRFRQNPCRRAHPKCHQLPG